MRHSHFGAATARYLSLILVSFFSASNANSAAFQVQVSGNNLYWGNDTAGYLQVQDATSWNTLCETYLQAQAGNQTHSSERAICTVPNGTYNVINHLTLQRIHGISVGTGDAVYTAPSVEYSNGLPSHSPSYQHIPAETIQTSPLKPNQPYGLKAQVYSDHALELFWDRQTTADSYDVYRAGVWLANIRGTSYFDAAIPHKGVWTYTLIAKSADGTPSVSSSILIDVPPINDATTLTIANAEKVLQQVVSIANREPFRRVETKIAQGRNLVSDLFTQFNAHGVHSANGLTLIPSSAGGVSSENASGLNGGHYSCDAGGSAYLPTAFSGTHGDGFSVQFNSCNLASGLYSGNAQQLPSEQGLLSHHVHDGIHIQSTADKIEYRFSSESRREQTNNDGILIQDVMTVPHFEAKHLENSTLTRVSHFRSDIQSRVRIDNGSSSVTLLDGSLQEAYARITFDAVLPDGNHSVLSVDIELSYSNRNHTNSPNHQWDWGSINIRAADSSALTAMPIEGDRSHIRIIVGDDVFDRPLSDGYSIQCLRDELSNCTTEHTPG